VRKSVTIPGMTGHVRRNTQKVWGGRTDRDLCEYLVICHVNSEQALGGMTDSLAW